ncbi:hypothetical protein TRVA0_004S00342 [Trichomonascus vanleenenianus]|uniref:universal stress protein n=1 Tax=Trichomonascus vanleenenianus TaxID=2268995 RepID=UPI003ECB1A97
MMTLAEKPTSTQLVVTSPEGTDMHHRKKDQFKPQVAFDTFDNKQASDFALTLRSKHEDYKYSRLTRTILCGIDENPHSDVALRWLFEELVEDGDEVVCLRVVDPNDRIGTSIGSDEKRYIDEAHRFLDHIKTRNVHTREILLVLEFTLGKVEQEFQRMVQIYEPSILVVGTRGRSMDGFKGLLPGSVSKYCLQHSPVPVVVVRPLSKREKRRAKREADPTRQTYRALIQDQEGDVTKSYDNGATEKAPPSLPMFLTARSQERERHRKSHGRSVSADHSLNPDLVHRRHLEISPQRSAESSRVSLLSRAGRSSSRSRSGSPFPSIDFRRKSWFGTNDGSTSSLS